MSDIHTPTLSADAKSFKFPSKSQANIGQKSVNSLHIFKNQRSCCIDARFCLSLLGEFQKPVDTKLACVNPALVYLRSTIVQFERMQGIKEKVHFME